MNEKASIMPSCLNVSHMALVKVRIHPLYLSPLQRYFYICNTYVASAGNIFEQQAVCLDCCSVVLLTKRRYIILTLFECSQIVFMLHFRELTDDDVFFNVEAFASTDNGHSAIQLSTTVHNGTCGCHWRMRCTYICLTDAPSRVSEGT